MQKRYFQPKFVEQVRAKNDIGQVVSSYIQTTKRGNATWALCPFHHEKTPSFAVNEEEQFFHCFGCGEGGDVIKFVQLIESISYPEAIEKLAERAGLEIPKDENSDEIIYEKKEKDEVLRALKLAMEIYHKNLYLPVAKKAQDYVKARNFKKSDLERFHMGYSDGSNIISNLFKFGVSSKTLVKAGIADEVLVQLAYAIGVARPVSIFVNTYGTNRTVFSDGEIAEKIGRMFDLRPAKIVQRFGLKNPIYLPTATYGHFGREPYVETVEIFRDGKKTKKEVTFFGWEKLDAVDEIKREFGL